MGPLRVCASACTPAARIRSAIASAARWAGSATSEPFTLQSHAPVVHIDTPRDQTRFTPNSQITLMGGARDAEDGPLDDGALTWLVNGQPSESGKEAAIAGLTPGTYTIALEAIDSNGNIATASVRISEQI